MTPSIKQGTTVATVEGYVTAAEKHGGGWVQLLIHHLCNGCDAYSMTVPDFTAFVDWLQGEVASGRVVVKTTDQVIGAPVANGFYGSFANHYSLLRTLEDAFGISTHLGGAASASTLGNIWAP